MPTGSKIGVSVALTKSVVQRLDQVRQPMSLSRSALIERLVLDGLDQVELTTRATSDPVVMGAFTRALAEPGVLRSLVDTLRADLSDDQLALFAQTAATTKKPPAQSFPPSLRQNREGGKRSKPRGK